MSDAQRASDRLAQEGIARTDLHVHAQDASRESEVPDDVSGSGGTPTRTVAADAEQGAPHEGGIAHFFKRLFGNDDAPEEAGHYRESVRRGHALLSVDVVDESQIDAVRAAMNDAGAMDIEERVTQWKAAGYSGYDSSAPAYTADEIAEDRRTFPVVREDLTIGRREVSTGGVRVYSRVTETPVSESVNLREEHATIERRTVDRPATEADRKEGAVEIRETAEEPVVAKTARVVEEVVVGKESSQRTETVNDTVRGTQVEVERDAGNAATGGADPVNRKPL
ncbi:MAG TPA: YsnF/AvaK domain-containing protein [Paraburkholderia sp.]|nr:YsnF/AvaK domain-containing protein [Paraburkholderia sp.]